MIQSGDFETGQGYGGNAAFWAGYCNGQTTDQNGTYYTAHTCSTTDWSLPQEHDNGLKHGPGTLAAAHAGVNTDGSQFYVVPSDSLPSHLDWEEGKDCSISSCHTVFGEVIKGMHFIDYISQVATGQNDRPVHDVIVTKAIITAGLDSDGDGLPDDIDDYPNDANETEDSDGDGVGDNSDPFPYDPSEYGDSDGDGVGDNEDDFPNDANETTDSDGDGTGDNSDAFPNDANETHDDDSDGVGNNTDEFPQDPDEQFDNDGDGVGNNADDFPDNAYASNWSTIYAAVGTLILLLIGAGVMISRMKKQDELPNVQSSSELQQLDKQIEELQQKKNKIVGQEDATELMFED
jgi:cyclophilin family peptidyl-prolyl cis-trans isomerase